MADIGYRTKKDYALTLIRELILRGELDAGSHLNQSELAARLNISLTPVREALRQLEAEGLVAATAHRGVRVRSADTTELRNVYIARRLVEPYVAARAAAHLTSGDVRSAAEMLKRLDRSESRGDAAGVRKANRDFHFLIYARCDVPLLVDTVHKLWMQYPWDVLTVVPSRMEASKREHREMLAAMEERDPRRLGAACTEQLVHSYLEIAAYLEGHAVSDPFEVEPVRDAVAAERRRG